MASQAQNLAQFRTAENHVDRDRPEGARLTSPEVGKPRRGARKTLALICAGN
jgi:hypothetical protein